MSETLPTLIVTRPVQQADALIRQLQAAGIAAQAFPLLDISATDDPAPLDAALAMLDDFALVVFVSPNAIDHALARLRQPWPAHVPIGVLGPGSVRALAVHGIAAPAVRIVSPVQQSAGVQRYDSEALLAALEGAGLSAVQLAGKRVLLVRGNGGRELLADQLRAAGAALTVVEAYRRSCPQPDAAQWHALRALDGVPHAWLLTSSEAVRNLLALADAHLDGAARTELLRSTCFVPHRRIADTARELGFTDVRLSGAGDTALVASAAHWARQIAAASESAAAPPQPPMPAELSAVSALPARATKPPRASGALPAWVPWFGGLALAALLAGGWMVRRLDHLTQELARRQQNNDSTVQEARLLAKTAQQQSGDLQGRLGALDARLTEVRDQQAALERLYQDLNLNREDWQLAEIEQILTTTAQQLQLTGNVQVALTALQNADARLARANRPQFGPLRRALARDIERLKALPNIDLAGAAIKLDEAVVMVDTLPMLADERAPAPAERAGIGSETRRTRPTQVQEESWTVLAERLWQGMRDELRALISLRRVDEPRALLISPDQSWFVRENLKLRLLNARLALLSRNEITFRSDLASAQDTLGKYFDTRSRRTQTAQMLLKQAQASAVSIELPMPGDSLAAVRSLKHGQ